MPIICPTVTAYDTDTYHDQMHLVARLASRIHIDLMDGVFAPTQSIEIEDAWWPYTVEADIHLMHQEPMLLLSRIIRMRPRMVVVHNEAYVHHMHFAAELHKEDIQVGLALLQETPVEWAEQIMHSFDHILVFSGNLGHHGGEADLGLLEKVSRIKQLYPEVEIGWDGGINATNVKKIANAGVDVLNVGGGIHNSDNSQVAYDTLVRELGDMR